ncbi:MAG: YaiI/YqxD family protein [Gemmataceae bacterium]
MYAVYIDADACPVKEEVYRVARRYGWRVVVVANTPLRVPGGPRIEAVVCSGFGAADDYIAEHAGVGDLVVTADIPLAARCLARDVRVLDPRGRPFTEADIGSALAMRALMEDLRAGGEVTGGPPPMTARDRSRFLARLDEAMTAVLRVHPPPPEPSD